MSVFSRYKLRYYYVEDMINFFHREHELILKLLEQIKKRVGIDYELYPIKSGQEEFIYEEHFKKRSRLLNKIHDLTVSQALKSRRGVIHIHGVIALVRDGQVVWYHEAWIRDFELWKQVADKVKQETELSWVNYNIAFLRLVLENPQYLENIIHQVERVLQGKIESLKPTHDDLVLRVIENLLSGSSNIAVLVEVPLGLRYIKSLAEKISVSDPTYRYALMEISLAAYPLRADLVAIQEPDSLKPGIYPCARGREQIFKLDRLYRTRFPNIHVQVIYAESLLKMNLNGKKVTVIEVKNCKIDEHAIGQVLTYEALLKLDLGISNVHKIIAAPREYLEQINPAIYAVIRALGIELMPIL
ncbi:MAG: hypothetical protein GXO26_01200 [Crenarchaeota archaeon]|nr:hypothetical protein [Thermoproteota archaeon]